MILRKATIEDSALLLQWRNDEITRTNSLNPDLVTAENHARWLKHSLETPGRILLIIEQTGVPVGTLRIDSLNDGKKELSWTIAPEHRSAGIGKRAVRTIVEKHPDWIFVARIKSSNRASIRIAEGAGFHFQREEDGVQFFSTQK